MNFLFCQCEITEENTSECLVLQWQSPPLPSRYTPSFCPDGVQDAVEQIHVKVEAELTRHVVRLHHRRVQDGVHLVRVRVHQRLVLRLQNYLR